ncbi:MAG: hypothetical protein IJL41_01895 [Clostridia bacterium]|nr:hypothetical protein [Clostridia bacterium]
MEKQKFNINDILEAAAAENDKQLLMEYKEPSKEEAPKEEKPASVAEKPADGSAPEGIGCETDELIGRYSQKIAVADKKTSTDSIRESLENSMANDKELLNVYRSLSARKKSHKVEELYNLINFATENDLKERSELETENPDSHFSSSAESERAEREHQQHFSGFDDTVLIDTEGVNKPVADFDEDYDSLSEKIESGELDFTDNSDTRQIPLINDKPAVKPAEPAVPDMDDKDKDLLRVLNIGQKGAEEPEGPKKSSGRKFGKKEKHKSARPAYEYVDKSQNSEIQELLTKATRSALGKLIIAFLLCIVVFYLELASPDSGAYSVYTRPGRFGILYLLVDFQVLCFMAITLLDSIKKGCIGLFTGKPCGESVFFALFAAAAAHTAVTAFMHPRADLGVFCLPCAVCGVCLAFVKYLECRKDYHCFKVVASTRAKYVAQQLKGDTKEAIEFYKYLFDDSEIYTTRKTAFVEGFFRRLHTRPESESLSGFAILLSFIAALGLGIYKAATGEPAYESVTQAIQTLCFALPVSSLFIISLPVIKANLIGKRNGSAFIGNAVGEEYADASVISFSDNEVYPSNLVKITSVKIYGDNRIDRILYDIAEVFAFAGGPLRTVTGNMITGGVPAPESARLIESASDGICVVINGNEMFLGKRDYMRRYRYDAPYDNSDAAFERKNGSVMFVVKGGQLIAKVYIKYHINPQFNSLLRDLYKAGMCVGIKTTDPNITGDLIEKSVKFKKTPISILKAGDVSDVEAECERVDSGIVANASLHTFLKMFIVCDKVRHVTKANGIINMLSLAVAFFVSLFLALTGQLIGLPSWYPAVFQLMWIIPVGVVSFLL